MAGTNRGPGRIVKQEKIYLATNIPTPDKGDKGFVVMSNVGAIARLTVPTEKRVRHGKLFRYKVIITDEVGAIATTLIFTILGTNDETANPLTSEHIILRTNPITLAAPVAVLEDNNIGFGIEFDTVDETGTDAEPNEGEMQLVIEQTGGTPDTDFKIKIYGDSDD